MRIEPLLSFCAVVEQGSFHKAAAKLYLSQPAVSMNIKQLEKEYGQLLINREGRNIVKLTPFGEKLYQRSLLLREQIEQLEMLKIESLRQNVYEITIDCNTPASIYLLTSLTSKFQEEYPNVLIAIHHKKREESIQEVLDGITDFVMLLSPDYHPELQSIAIWEDELVIITEPENPLAQTYLTVTDLINQSFILPPKGLPTRTIIDEFFIKHFGKTANCMLEVGNPEGLKHSVLSLKKAGIILASTIQYEIQHNLLKVVPTELKMSCQHILFHKKNRFHPETMRNFTDLIMQRSK